MSERTIADDLVDWLVYAPIGAVVTVTEDLPGLVEKGRRRMRVVRFAGNVALKVARYRIDSYVDSVRAREAQRREEAKQAAVELEMIAATTAAAAAAASESSPAGPNGTAADLADTHGDDHAAYADGTATATVTTGNGGRGHDGDRPATGGRRSGGKAAGAGTAPGRGHGSRGAGALAIPDYDTLAAAQVVKLLPGLTRAELEAVRRHELAGRSRATILNRIAQLTDGHAPRKRR